MALVSQLTFSAPYHFSSFQHLLGLTDVCFLHLERICESHLMSTSGVFLIFFFFFFLTDFHHTQQIDYHFNHSQYCRQLGLMYAHHSIWCKNEEYRSLWTVSLVCFEFLKCVQEMKTRQWAVLVPLTLSLKPVS